VALTSLSEAQPLVALEAMGAGVPVVSTAVGGCAETIAGAGLLTPARSPRATADALLRLADDRDLRERLGAAGRRRVALRHRPQDVHGAYRALYEQLAA
jgi:glycosyltransferase involved in cell wall biosynthesis